MKIKYFLIHLIGLLAITFYNQVEAQECISNDPEAPCCNDLISTDPAPGKAYNPEVPGFINKFDWTQNVNINAFHPDGLYGSLPSTPLPMGLPFYTSDSYLEHINYSSFTNPADKIPANVDVHPEDGWELIHRNFGYELDETTLIPLANNTRPGPYLILYNKYSGILRVLVSMDQIGTHQTLETSIQFDNPIALNYAGIFGHFGQTSQPLDQESRDIYVASSVDFPANKGWSVADFNMAYDPCVCHYDSRLKINFSVIDVANAEMEGRFIATSVPLNTSGTSPLLGGDGFLVNVTKDPNFSVNGGMLTYHNIDKLIDKYKAPTNTGSPSALEIEALKLLKGLLTKQSKSIDKKINKVINTHATPLVNNIFSNGNSDLINFISGKSVLGLQYGIAARGAKYLISQITPEENKPVVPNISFIEGEMVMRGTIETRDNLEVAEIKFYNPGSVNTPTLTNWQNYPSYNEALGLFAMIETPKVKDYEFKYHGNLTKGWISNWNGTEHAEVVTQYEINDGNVRIDEGTQFVLDGGLKYAFNPAAGVNVEKTTIHLAWVLKSNTTADQVGDFKAVSTAKTPVPQWREFTTDFFPLSCLNNNQLGALWRLESTENIVIKNPALDDDPNAELTATVSKPVFITPAAQDLQLKVMINYEFLPNAQGKINHSYEVLIYPLQETFPENFPAYNGSTNAFFQVDLERFESYPVLKTFTTDQNFLYNQTIIARDQIIIAANLTADPGVHVIIKAAEIDVLPGYEIGEGIELIAMSPVTCGAPVPPMNAADIKTFCTGSNYKARNSQAKYRALNNRTESDPNENNIDLFSFDIFPNPAQHQVYYRSFTDEQSEGGTLSLRTITGNVIKTQFIAGGRQQGEIDLNNVSKGIYMVTFEGSGKMITKKLVLLE